MTATCGEPSDGAALAARLVRVTDATVPAAVHQASATLAARLADEAGLPVTVATAPVDRLDALRDSLGRDADVRRREYAPTPRADASQPMSSAPFLWRPDCRPDLGSMGTTFCELPLYGGPPHPARGG